MADHRAEVVPIVDLRARFALPQRTEASKKIKWILVDVAKRTVGLIVDDVLDVLPVPVADFRPAPELGGGEQARGIANVVTHEGELVFVLDLARFEKLAESFDHRGLVPNGEGKREDRT